MKRALVFWVSTLNLLLINWELPAVSFSISENPKLIYWNRRRRLLLYRVSMASNNQPSALDKEQIFGMAEKEMEYRVELFNKLTHTCFNKCIEKRYKESELNMGENSCIDRCVSKYWQVTNMIGQLLGSNRPPM